MPRKKLVPGATPSRVRHSRAASLKVFYPATRESVASVMGSLLDSMSVRREEPYFGEFVRSKLDALARAASAQKRRPAADAPPSPASGDGDGQVSLAVLDEWATSFSIQQHDRERSRRGRW